MFTNLPIKAQYNNNGIILFLVILGLSQLTSCYEPEELIPPVYLEPEVSLVVDNVPWDSSSTGEIHIDLQRNYLSMILTDNDGASWFSCVVKGNDSKLFSDYLTVSEMPQIKPGIYKSNDSLLVTMYYRTSIDGKKTIDVRETIYWYGSDENFNVWTIDEVYFYEGARYISGGFTSRTRTADSNNFPRYRYIGGSFKNIRVTKTYPITK